MCDQFVRLARQKHKRRPLACLLGYPGTCRPALCDTTYKQQGAVSGRRKSTVDEVGTVRPGRHGRRWFFELGFRVMRDMGFAAEPPKSDPCQMSGRTL